MDNLRSFAREQENLIDTSGTELRKVGLIPNFVPVDAAAITGGDGANEGALVLDVSGFSG